MLCSPLARRRASLVVAGMLLAAACGDPGKSGPASVAEPSRPGAGSAPGSGRIASITVTIDSTTLTPPHQAQARSVLRNAQGQIVSGNVTWSSSDASVATVDSVGIVTARAAGAATIIATSEGISASTGLTVVAASQPPQSPPPSSPPTSSEVVFADGFESGDFRFRQNGVFWSAPQSVGVTSAIAHTGRYSAVFDQSDGWSELRFDGLPRMPEVYMQFWLYMPSGDERPSLGPRISPLGTMNDKFFRLWGNSDDDYSLDGTGNGNKVGASTYGDGGGVNGTLAIEYTYSQNANSQWGMGRGNPPTQAVSFINDANRGRWIKIGIHAKHATAANNDGVVEIFLDGKLLTGYRDLQNYPFGAQARHTFTTGYILGWLNNGGRPGQKVYVDDVTFSAFGFPP